MVEKTKAIEQAKETAEENGYHVCDCAEFMKAIIYEETNQNFA